MSSAGDLGMRRPLAAFLGAALFFVGLTAWRFQDVVGGLGTGFFRQTGMALERSDQILHAWTLDWVFHRLATAPLELFDANIFYPQPDSLALSDHLVGEAATLLPLRAVTTDPLHLNALGTLATFVLAGLGVWLLVVALTGSAPAGLVAGALFAFNPFRTHSLAQIQLLADYAVPLAFLFLHRYRRHGRGRDLVGLAAAVAWQSLCGAYLAAFLAVPVAALLAWDLRRRRPGWRPALLAFAVGGVIAGPFLYPYVRLEETPGHHQHLLNGVAFSLGLEDLVCWRDCPGAWAFGRTLVPVTVALAAVGLWPRGAARGGAAPGTWLAVVVVSAVVGLGPYVHVSSSLRADAAPGFVAPAPYLLLYRWVPGFDGLRAPVRAVALVHFGLAVLAGLGAARLTAAAGSARGRLVVGGGLVVLAALASDRPAVTFEQVSRLRRPPSVYGWLATEPAGGPIVEIPVERTDALFMYYSRIHRRPLVNGYSGFLPYPIRYLRARLRCYPCATGLEALAELGVRTHVVHLGRVRGPVGRRLADRIAAAPSLAVTRRFGDDTLIVEETGPAGAGAPPPPAAPLDRAHWRLTSSSGPRGVERAVDGSLATSWSTAPALEDLVHPGAGLRLLAGLGSWRDLFALVPRGEQWLAIDLGGPRAVGRLRVALGERGGPFGAPVPVVEGSLDGVTWRTLAATAAVRPTLRALIDGDPAARFEYAWPAATVAHLRLRHPGHWFVYDVAAFE